MILRTRHNAASLTINEPIRDPKGKKRAAPEPTEDESSGSSTKRPKTSSYSLRSPASSFQLEMPRKLRSVSSCVPFHINITVESV
jgi:E3 ubiquitin-protein ligase TRIP12